MLLNLCANFKCSKLYLYLHFIRLYVFDRFNSAFYFHDHLILLWSLGRFFDFNKLIFIFDHQLIFIVK